MWGVDVNSHTYRASMRNEAWSARCLNFVTLMFLVTQADLLLDLMFDMFVMLVDIGDPIDCPLPRAPLISVCVILDNFCFMLDVISFYHVRSAFSQDLWHWQVLSFCLKMIRSLPQLRKVCTGTNRRLARMYSKASDIYRLGCRRPFKYMVHLRDGSTFSRFHVWYSSPTSFPCI